MVDQKHFDWTLPRIKTQAKLFLQGTLAQLRQSVQRKVSDVEIQALVDQVDKVELEDERETQAQFHRDVDPALTPIQRAKLRVFEINIDNQIADLVLRARGGVPAPRPSSPSAPN